MARAFAIAAIAIVWAAPAVAQDQGGVTVSNHQEPIRVPIRSADPWFIKMMLEGSQITQPEYSTIWGVQGVGGGQGGFGGGQGGFGGGQQGGFGGGRGGFGGGQQGGFGNQGFGGSGQNGGQGGFAGGQQGGRGGGVGGGQQGGRGGNQGQGASLLPPGWTVMVNPNDNSLWLIPPKG